MSATTSPPGSTLRILIADADADTRGLYRAALRSTGCDVIDAADGREALVSALVHRPSLVIAETQLPIFDGFQLCEVLRHDSQTSDVPILIVTGESRQSELDRAREAGADSVLVKPVTPEALLVEVKRLVGDVPPKPDRTSTDPAHLPHPALRRRQAKAYRVETAHPPMEPPQLVCPACDRPLDYDRSHLGGVKAAREQWDSYTCSASCGTFEYRQRTRRIRRVS